jgi:hypothetical protein
MDTQLQEAWNQLAKAASVEQSTSAIALCLYLVMGGLMSLYVRFLYRRFGASANDADSVTRVFPLLTLVTIGVISVVKSSMALSLGLVGALSIVRFRAAIKEPEELVYLFLCIGIGLGLGAGQPLLAIVLLLVSSVFIVSMHRGTQSRREQRLLLTITGDAQPYFGSDDRSASFALEQLVERFKVQRLDIENDRGCLRVLLPESTPTDTNRMLAALRERLPGCELSYVNLERGA